MRICGIIAEYDPFHRGHAYHMTRAKALSAAEGVIVALSGPFTQRGEPAFCPPHARAKAAAANGADMAVRLPFPYACAPAQRFALGGVKVLGGLGCTDFAFGSECGDVGVLKEMAAFLKEEPRAYRQAVQFHLKQGYALPKARELALDECRPDLPLPLCKALLTSPNDGLALCYLAENAALPRPMTPHAVKRTAAHGSSDHTGAYASGSALRQAIRFGGLSPDVIRQLPDPAVAARPTPLAAREAILLWTLRRSSREEVQQWYDLPGDIANALYNARMLPSAEAVLRRAGSRAVTAARLKRSWLWAAAGCYEGDNAALKEAGDPVYARILALKKDSPLPACVKNRADIPLVTKAADFCPEGALKTLAGMEEKADALYALLRGEPGDAMRKTPPVIV